MIISHSIIRALFSVSIVPVMVTFGGCENVSIGTETNPSTVRCATADDVVARFNEMNGQELVNVVGLVNLFHPENEWQERLMESIHAALPIYELDAVMRAEFNTPFQSTPLDAFFASPFKPARLVESDDSRAMAMFTDLNSRAQRLHLVKHNGSWWISAATLENDTVIKESFDESLLLGMTSDRQALCIAAPGIIQRIKAAEFYSAKNARKAIDEAVAGK